MNNAKVIHCMTSIPELTVSQRIMTTLWVEVQNVESTRDSLRRVFLRIDSSGVEAQHVDLTKHSDTHMKAILKNLVESGWKFEMYSQ